MLNAIKRIILLSHKWPRPKRLRQRPAFAGWLIPLRHICPMWNCRTKAATHCTNCDSGIRRTYRYKFSTSWRPRRLLELSIRYTPVFACYLYSRASEEKPATSRVTNDIFQFAKVLSELRKQSKFPFTTPQGQFFNTLCSPAYWNLL